MSTDRKTLLEHRAIAKRAMHDLDLSDKARTAARQVFHRTTVVLGMQDAAERAKARRSAPSEALSEAALIDSPSPFAPTKELQAFLDQWQASPKAKESGLLLQVHQVQAELERRQWEGIDDASWRVTGSS